MTSMIRLFRRAVTLIAVFGSQPGYGASHSGKLIQFLLVDTRACAFITLDGVSVADSSLSSSPWFSLPKSGSNFSEMYAILLSAKLAGRSISITTDGTSSCGHATVTVLTLD